MYDLKGVILLPRSVFREDLYVYTHSKILDCFGLKEFQLYYYIMISGNDFTKNHAEKLGDGREASVLNTLDYIRENCKSKRECKEDYEEMFPDDDAMEEFDMLQKYYSCEQVEAPWSSLTTDVESVDEIKTKVPEGLAQWMVFESLENLKTIRRELRRNCQKLARNYMFSPYFGFPLIQAVEFEEQCRDDGGNGE